MHQIAIFYKYFISINNFQFFAIWSMRSLSVYIFMVNCYMLGKVIIETFVWSIMVLALLTKRISILLLSVYRFSITRCWHWIHTTDGCMRTVMLTVMFNSLILKITPTSFLLIHRAIILDFKFKLFALFIKTGPRSWQCHVLFRERP